MDETWSYHYNPETKQQSMEWRHSGSPSPKKFRVQKSAGKVLAPNVLGSRRHPPHWLSFKGPNYQRGVLLISAGAIKGHFEGKTPREGHQGGLVLARQCPGSPGTCNPQKKNWSTWTSNVLITHPILRIWPCQLPTVPWIEKTIEKSPFFVRRGGHYCRGDLIGRTNFWIFLSGLQKLEQRAKKCIELRGEYVE